MKQARKQEVYRIYKNGELKKEEYDPVRAYLTFSMCKEIKPEDDWEIQIEEVE